MTRSRTRDPLQMRARAIACQREVLHHAGLPCAVCAMIVMSCDVLPSACADEAAGRMRTALAITSERRRAAEAEALAARNAEWCASVLQPRREFTTSECAHTLRWGRTERRWDERMRPLQQARLQKEAARRVAAEEAEAERLAAQAQLAEEEAQRELMHQAQVAAAEKAADERKRAKRDALTRLVEGRPLAAARAAPAPKAELGKPAFARGGPLPQPRAASAPKPSRVGARSPSPRQLVRDSPEAQAARVEHAIRERACGARAVRNG